MDYPGVRFLSNLRAPSSMPDAPDIAQESVDLLQMVPPETGRMTSHTLPHRCTEDPLHAGDPAAHRHIAPTDTPPRRHMRVLLVQDEENMENSAREENADPRSNIETDSGLGSAHVCQNCSHEGSIYYNRAGADMSHYECRHNHDTTRDGSVYFNYLQLANRSRTQTLPASQNLLASSTYEPIENRGASLDSRKNNHRKPPHKPLKPPKPPKPPKPTKANNKERSTTNTTCRNFVFNCCKSNNITNSTKTKPKCNKSSIEEGIYGTSAYHAASTNAASSSSSPAILNNNRARKRHEWTRVKRLLFLVGILLGILVALGGIVVGFVVLAPHKNKQGTGDALPENPEKARQPEIIEVVTLEPNFEKPVKDAKGWVYFSQGHANGGSKYTILNRAMLYSKAQDQCSDLGAHLIHVNSIREQVFLEDYVSEELKDIEIRRDAVGFWLGARRQRGSHHGTCQYDQWKWKDAYGRDHGTIKGFTAFIPGKPDNVYSPEECLFLSYKDGAPGSESYLKWDDAPCDIPSVGNFKVICELDSR